MGFWQDLSLLFKGAKKPSFRKIDWLDIESRWRTVQSLIQSSNQADLKQAIIQADIMIDTIMKAAGVKGATFGDRLKTLKPDLPRPVYQKLWTAHLKRNELVHEPGSFVADWEKQTHLAAYEQAMSTLRGMS